MTDRFDVQLRAHLIETANTRPADGQLATFAARLATTPQRSSLVARVLSAPGQMGSLRIARFRSGLIVVAVVVASAGLAVVGGSGFPLRSGAFEGTWTSTDPLDGSARFLVVGTGSAPTLEFVDEEATAGFCDADPVKVFTAEGHGTVEGDRLTAVWPKGGSCGLATMQLATGPYTYDQATDTLVDDEQVRWVRARSAEPPPTRGPLPSIVARQAGCFDVPAGATYRNDVRPFSLTVTIPADAELTWESDGDSGFSLVGDCYDLLGNSGPFIAASIVSYVDGTCETGDAGAVGTTAEAVDAVVAARGVATAEPVITSLDGRAATRFEVASNAGVCFPGVTLWNGFDVGGGEIFYLVDVDGLPLGITISGSPDDGDRASAITEAEAIIASLRIDLIPGARPTREPVPTVDPGCIQLDDTGTYTAPIGPVSVTATVPNEGAIYWSGRPDWFGLSRSPCGLDAPLYFQTALISRVAVDACRALGDSVEVHTAAEAGAALADQSSTDVTGQTDVTIDGNPAVRLEISPQPGLDTVTCDEGATLLLGQTVEDPFIRIDWTYTVYLIDFDGAILAINPVIDGGDEIPDSGLLDEIDAIMSSLELRGRDG